MQKYVIRRLLLAVPVLLLSSLIVFGLMRVMPGDALFANEPISVSLKKAIPVTLELAALAIVLGITIAVPIGVLSATRQDTAADYAGRVVAVSGLSIPDFWLAPLVTIIGGQLGTLLAGTFVIEQIFALPGMGRLTVEAILYRDYPVVQTNVMLVAATLVSLNLLVDLTYAWLDPRIRYQ